MAAPKKLPKGMQAGLDRLEIDPTKPETAPVVAVPVAPEPIVVVPIEPTMRVPGDPLVEESSSDDGLQLTFGEAPAVATVAQRQNTIAEQAIELLQARAAEQDRQIAELTAKLNAAPAATSDTAEFNPERVDTDALPGEAFDQLMAVLRPSITSYVDMRIEQMLSKVGTDVEQRIGTVVRKQTTDSLKDRVQKRARSELNVDFNRVSESNEFKLFLEELVPGVGLKTGMVLSRAWGTGDEDVMLTQIKRFVERYRRGDPAATVTAPATAAPGAQFGRGGSAAPARHSRNELYAQMDQARRKRDQPTLGKLMEKLEAAEKAGLLVD